MKTVVQTTILRVQEDSNTFRQAASFARFGYRSIVVEGQPSTLSRAELPFELISIGKRNDHEGEGFRSDPGQATANTKGALGRLLVLPAMAFRALAALPFQLMTAWDDESEAPGWLQAERRRNILVRLSDVLTLKLVSPTYGRLPKPLKRAYEAVVVWTCFVIYLVYFARVYVVAPLRYLPKASLYYMNAPYNFPAVYLASRLRRAPFIYQAHDFYTGIGEKDRPTLLDKRWIDPFLFRLEQSCINSAAAVVTVCDGVARLQEKAFGCHPVVIRSCHDDRLGSRPEMRLRDALALGPEDFLIVTVGQAKKGQAAREALEAMLKLPDNVHLAFLGKNTAQHAPLIRDLGLERRVHPVPAVMPFEVVPFVASADGALMLYYARSPNYENCLPNGLFQAIAAELPLLYPELPEIRKIAEHYGLGIPINPLDPDSIRAGVMQLMSDRGLREELRRNLSVAKEELSWEREEIILRDLISGVLGGGAE